MTLILSTVGEKTGLFTVGDILLSRATAEPVKLPLPLQFGPYQRVGSHGTLSGLAQKTTLVAPHAMTLWAGNYVVARLLVSQIRDAAKQPDTYLDLQAIIAQSGLGEEELAGVSIILHQIHDRQLRVDGFNVLDGYLDGVRALWSGSGSFDFMTDTQIASLKADQSPEATLRGFMVRLMAVLLGEAMYEATYDYLYGGWFELVISRTLGLRKIPYAIKFWERRGQDYGYDAPLLFNWYKDKALFICALTNASAKARIRTVKIPDLLSGKAWQPVRVAPIFKPEFTFHVIMDRALNHHEIVVSDRHSVGHLNVRVNRRGDYEMVVRREFMDMMMGRCSTPQYQSSKASEPDV